MMILVSKQKFSADINRIKNDKHISAKCKLRFTAISGFLYVTIVGRFSSSQVKAHF